MVAMFHIPGRSPQKTASLRRAFLSLAAAMVAGTVLGASASADVVSIGAATLSANGAEIQNAGTVLAAWNVNGNAVSTPTVNGIAFTNTQPSTITLSSGWTAPVQDDAVTGASYTGNMVQVMNDMIGTSLGTNSTVTLSGLTVGETYLVQMFHHQNQGGSRQMAVRFGNDASKQTAIFNPNGSQGYISTVEFVADSTSQLFTVIVAGGARGLLNGIVVEQINAVPAPAAFGSGLALLVGCGVVRRWRRRD